MNGLKVYKGIIMIVIEYLRKRYLFKGKKSIASCVMYFFLKCKSLVII